MTTDYTAARLNMVESQVRPNKVTDLRLIAAMMELPRERFVGEAQRGVAYVDEDLPLGGGRFLMEPMVLARLVQVARVGADDVVLNVGAGGGYDAAVLARLAKRVVALESDAALARRATEALAAQGTHNVEVVSGPLADGYAARAPYNVIVFGGAVEQVPARICDQLADGGRLVAVVAPPGEQGRATLFTKLAGVMSHRVVFDAGSRLLPGFQLEPGFAF